MKILEKTIKTLIYDYCLNILFSNLERFKYNIPAEVIKIINKNFKGIQLYVKYNPPIPDPQEQYFMKIFNATISIDNSYSNLIIRYEKIGNWFMPYGFNPHRKITTIPINLIENTFTPSENNYVALTIILICNDLYFLKNNT